MTDRLLNIAQGVAKAHVYTYNAEFSIVEVSQKGNSKGLYLASINHSSFGTPFEEVINVIGLSSDIAEDYMHCRIHGMIAKFLSRLYPSKIP